jgi:hypothetical protein
VLRELSGIRFEITDKHLKFLKYAETLSHWQNHIIWLIILLTSQTVNAIANNNATLVMMLKQ